jgi:hypothetical protein
MSIRWKVAVAMTRTAMFKITGGGGSSIAGAKSWSESIALFPRNLRLTLQYCAGWTFDREVSSGEHVGRH